jgi:exonuclease III
MKFKSSFKNQSCRNRELKTHQVVRIVNLNYSGSHPSQQNKDKYSISYKKLPLRFLNCNIECQIIQLHNVTKIERLRAKNSQEQIQIFYQIPKIPTEPANTSNTTSNVLKKLFLMYKESKKQSNQLHQPIFLRSVSFVTDWGRAKKNIIQSGDVELNPGPEPGSEAGSSRDEELEINMAEIKILTYNVRGMKDKLKLKRVLNKCNRLIQENRDSFILLQETHLDEEECKQIGLHWRQGYVRSPAIGRQGGTLILYSSTWENIHSENDNYGRFCSLIVSKYCQKLCIINVYAPNDHDIEFFNSVYNKTYEYKGQFPEIKVVIGGDFNLVLGQGDSKNRRANNAERRSKNFILEQNTALNLRDSFRVNNPTGGYTWSRGDCMSRLDMILVCNSVINLGVVSKLDWTFDISDHAMLETRFKIKNILKRGRGLFRLNASILENHHSLDEVRAELSFQLSLIPTHWDPHKKLDYVKMSIRSVIGLVSGKQAKNENTENEALTNQLNLLRKSKEEILISGNNPQLILEIDMAISQLETEYEEILDKKAKFLVRRSGAKWYEEGERSNSYFLNLINRRTEQTLITKLNVNGEVITEQTKISEHIVNFYKNLYSEKDTSDNFDEFFVDLPKLTDDERRNLDAPITLTELEATLRGCDESAPGPDGISYTVYKKLWPEVGRYLLQAWEHSVSIGILPEDQRASCITLLPKAGKDLEIIENWRPITLTNCDLKIFTKLISNRVSKVLDKLISPSQTAYIPGRVVHDNLRMFNFYKEYCKKHNVDALLVSLDAKKAFDSVSHKYMHEVLDRYGFSEEFISTIKLLYNDIKASILVNGFKSVMIRIERSVKQGDALSCALFILCIDPLIRRMEENDNIESVPIPRSVYSNIKIKNKVGGFADDIGLAIKNNISSVKAIFEEYATFSDVSGIELNIEKTEILQLNIDSSDTPFVPATYRIGNKGINTSESIKICGITFSNNSAVEYQRNVLDKITKLEKQIVMWLPRHLSVEGKLTIVKTFGLSQLIFSLQMCKIEDYDVNKVESIIYRFLWNKKWVGNAAPDRIKRVVLKQSYENGGLNAPDIRNLDMALKTKQFIRAISSNHAINNIQKFLLEKEGYFEYYKIEYAKICNSDIIIANYQQTVNILTDRIRLGVDQGIVDNEGAIQSRTNIIASTDIIEYFKRRNIPLVIHRFRQLANQGIGSLHELINEYRFPRDAGLQTCAEEVLSFIPTEWVNLVVNAEDVNAEITYEECFLSHTWQLVEPRLVSVKSLRTSLLRSQVTRPYLNYNKFELNIVDRELNPYVISRNSLFAPRDRFYKYRILHGDIFCNSRMYKFKMVESPNCDNCPGTIETIKHVLWDCPRAAGAWYFLNAETREWLGQNYITYESVILGNPDVNAAMETIITWVTKLILTKNRDFISNEQIKAKFKTLFYYEKQLFGINSKKMRSRWGPLLQKFSNE